MKSNLQNRIKISVLATVLFATFVFVGWMASMAVQMIAYMDVFADAVK